MTAQATHLVPPTQEPADLPISEPIDELRRYTPEEVAAKGWLPYTARMIREKAYKHEIQCHKDGGRISLTADDIRAYNDRTVIRPFVKSA